MSRADNYFNLITKWERQKRTEKEIVSKFSELLINNPEDFELYYDINDALYWKGYSYQFEVFKENRNAWDANKYAKLVSNVTKSKEKTKELCLYLAEMLILI